MSLPRSRSHIGPTNPMNKPQTIPKWKHDSRSKGLSCPAKALMDGPRARGGWYERTRRTARDTRADLPLNSIGPLAAHPKTRTVRMLHADCLRATRTARTVRGLCADGPPNPFQPKTVGQTDRNEDDQEHATDTKNPRTKGSAQTVHGLQADYPPGTNRAARAPNREHNLTYPSMYLPNGQSSCRKIWGRCEASLGNAMP
jgi:hypothetical protein